MALRLGDIAPDFEQDSSAGRIRFHEWLGERWGVLFSHPADFTPVNWKQGEDVIIVPSLQDPDVLKQKFPKGYRAVKPYLRYTPQPDR